MPRFLCIACAAGLFIAAAASANSHLSQDAQVNDARVLVGNPQKEIAVNINNFLGQIRARRKLSGYLSLSIEQNDNINRASDTETIYLFGLPFVLGEQSRPQSETGLFGIATVSGAVFN